MFATGALLALLAASTVVETPRPRLAPTPPQPGASALVGPIILFLVDNSASLPPLDPEEKRTVALERMFGFLEGKPYRLILFGGRQEIYVDDLTYYRNNGLWTDFYFAFDRARQLMTEYPPGTEFRIILLTDAIGDPGPEDWKDMNVPEGADLKVFALQKTADLLRDMKQQLFVILVGNAPIEGDIRQDIEQTPVNMLELVRAANGPAAAPLAQNLAAFFGDNGLLLRKFIFRVAPHEGLKKIEPVVKRIAAPAKPGVEVQFLSFFLLPLILFLLLLLGILVRSFPGPGDMEILELSVGVPAHVAVDRLHKIDGGWAGTGLSLVPEAKDAEGTLSYQAPSLDLSGKGLETDGLDAIGLKLLPLPLEAMRGTLDELSSRGNKDEKIFVLNLDYMAKNMEPAEAERLLTTPVVERRRTSPLDFLRAKAHLLGNDALRKRLTEPKLQYAGYGKGGERKELTPGTAVRVGRYGFVVKDVTRGGRKDVRLSLYYERVPSVLGLKTILPDAFQRAFRFRRSSQRVVA
jgi:hypothetical protein